MTAPTVKGDTQKVDDKVNVVLPNGKSLTSSVETYLNLPDVTPEGQIVRVFD